MNRFIKIMNDNEQQYLGVIKGILNDTKVKLSEAKDKYMEDKVSKYEDKIIKDSMEKIRGVQREYLESTAKLLDNAQWQMQNPQIVTLSNTEKLLSEIRKSNELQMNRLKIASMSNDDIIESCIGCSNEAYVLQAKQELLNRANAMEDAAGNELRATARGLKHYTEQMELEDALKEFEAMSADVNLMPGVSMGEKLIINDIEGFLLQGTRLAEERALAATD